MASKMMRRGQMVAKSAVQAMERRGAPSLTTVPASSMDSLFPMMHGLTGMPGNTSLPSLPRSADFPMPEPVALKFNIPTKAVPTVDASKGATPLMQVEPNLYAKLEGFNTGGSIKDRAVMQCTVGMLKSGKLKPGDTLAVCTSGNAGRSLLHVQDMLKKAGTQIHVKIFMPRRYLSRDVPSAIAELDGVETVRGDRDTSSYALNAEDGKVTRFLHGLDGEFLEVQEKMSILCKDHGWATLDQHYDMNSLHAHQSTAEELMKQLPSMTDVVCTTGTGGTASGLRRYLPSHVTVHARPGLPGTIDGITDVRRYDNFCNTDLLQDYAKEHFDVEDTLANQTELKAKYNITAGQSSGAAYALAKEILGKNSKAEVVFICADGTADSIE